MDLHAKLQTAHAELERARAEKAEAEVVKAREITDEMVGKAKTSRLQEWFHNHHGQEGDQILDEFVRAALEAALREETP